MSEHDVEDSLEDLMMAIGRLTCYVFDTPERLTTVKENKEAVTQCLQRVVDRLAAARGRGTVPQERHDKNRWDDDGGSRD